MNNSDDDLDNRGETQRKSRSAQGRVSVDRRGAGHHMVVGIIVLALGMMFLLRNFGIIPHLSPWSFWPAILIVVGVVNILNARSTLSMFSGAIVAGLGALFLANNLGYLPWYHWSLLWPVLLIAVGLLLLLNGFGGQGHWRGVHAFVDDRSESSHDVLREIAIFGGVKRRVQTQDFQGGEATAIFGGVEIDLRRASTARDEIEIVANAMFGGVEIAVPDTWDVAVRGAGILGGYDDKTYPLPASEVGRRPRVTIRGSAMFGGVVVKN